MSNIPFIIISVITILYMFISIRKGKLEIAASFAWVLFCIAMLLLSIFPYSIDYFAQMLGISYPPALLLVICVVVLFIMSFSQDKKINELSKKNSALAQEISILKGAGKKSEKKKK